MRAKSKVAPWLLEKCLLGRRRTSPEDRIAMREAPEELDNCLVGLGILGLLSIAQRPKEGDGSRLHGRIFSVLEGQIKEQALVVREAGIVVAGDGLVSQGERLGVSGKSSRRATEHIARKLIEPRILGEPLRGLQLLEPVAQDVGGPIGGPRFSHAIISQRAVLPMALSDERRCDHRNDETEIDWLQLLAGVNTAAVYHARSSGRIRSERPSHRQARPFTWRFAVRLRTRERA